MDFKKLLKKLSFLIIVGVLLFFGACGTEPQDEPLNLEELLPEGAVAEYTHAYPDFNVTLVGEKKANVSVKFGEKFLMIDGIEDAAAREKAAKYVLRYLENPNKKAEDKARREANQKLPPKEKLATFVKRMKKNYPEFEYEWVGLGEGNVKVEYGDNSLLISGVEPDGAREEIAHGLIRIQKRIDKLVKQDK